jgi:uncharacterized protein (DUF433 family)
MSTSAAPEPPVLWNYLAPNPKSHYKQLFLKGTGIRAEVIYGWTVDGSEPATVEEVAAGYGLPLEAVHEAIAYCLSRPPELEQDHKREEARMKVTDMIDPTYSGRPRILTAQEIARLKQP